MSDKIDTIVYGKSKEACIKHGTHLTSCDNDGFCNYCGHQEDKETDSLSTAQVIAAIAETLEQNGGHYIEGIANQVLTNPVVYFGDDVFYEKKNYTVEVRVNCTLEQANALTSSVSDFADNLIDGIDADTVLTDDNGREIND